MPESREAIWLGEADVASLCDITTAIEGIAAALRALSVGQAHDMLKTNTAWPGTDGSTRPITLHAIGGALPQSGWAGTKTWVNAPSGSQPRLLLFEAATGRLRAVIEATLLGELRTAAVSAIATDLLADPDAQTMAMIGAGRQAFPQVAAIAAVRRLAEVRVWSRTMVRAAGLAERITALLGVRARTVTSVAEAVKGVDIVTLCTRATEPILRANDVGDDVHINAIGAITPERTEFEASLLDRCNMVVVDSRAAARKLSNEIRTAYGEDPIRWNSVVELADLVAAPPPSQPRLSLFKAMGIGIADVALGALCVSRAGECGRGQRIQTSSSPVDLVRPFLVSKAPMEQQR